jgi:hypothetical protein
LQRSSKEAAAALTGLAFAHWHVSITIQQRITWSPAYIFICVVSLHAAGQPSIQLWAMKQTAAILAVVLVLACTVSTSAAPIPRRLLATNTHPHQSQQDACMAQCQTEYQDNVQKCIADTNMGEPPVIAYSHSATGSALGAPAQEYVRPTQTAFQMAELKCRDLQMPELQKCQVGCVPPSAVESCAEKCDKSFGVGTMLAAWCRQKSGC